MLKLEENRILDALKKYGNGLRPSTFFIRYANNNNEEVVVVTHEGGMLNLEPIEGTIVPNLTWDMAERYVNEDIFIQDCMLEVSPGWRDFVISGINSDTM